MRTFAALIIAVFLFGLADAPAQEDQVRESLKMVARGQLDAVKNKLPDLLAQYPNDPGVMLLHGVVIEDGWLALEKYRTVINKYPQSQWADDAYWRIVQFYAIAGDTAKAQRHLQEFRAEYPTSEFLAPATDVVRSATGLARKSNKRMVHTPTSAERKSAASAQSPSHTSPKKKAAEAATPEPTTEPVRRSAARTETEPQPVRRAESIEEAVPDNADAYGLQVGIYSTREAATLEMKKFLKQRMYTEVKEKEVDGKTMYAVVIGNYTSLESATAAKKIVKQQCGCNPIIFPK
jgi:cell division septation protein DedD